MRLRQLVLACSLTTFILSSGANALGLGEASVKSSLNQPLQAEIKLLDTRDLTAEQIMVALASPADFERNGIDRPYFYTEFQFDVRLDAPDGPKVIVTSYSPVREPYLNFLVEAKWSAGRLLREYTLLMDLPNFDDNRAAPTITSTPVAATQPKTSPQSKAKVRQAPSRASQVAELSSDQYKVQANDTLWEIARRASRSSGASIHQAMIAIYEANPDAFINQNINLLRRGQVLRIPNAEEQANRSNRESIARFAQLAQVGGEAYGAQLDASSRQMGTQSTAQEAQGRVTLSASARGEGQGSGADKGRTAALENELNTTLEELDRSRAENAELASRIRDLEEQVETMESLVQVSNEKLKAMQIAAQQVDAPQDDAIADAMSSESATSEPAVVPAVAAVASSAESSVTSSAAKSSAAAVARGPVRAPTLMDTLSENAPWIGLAAALLVGGGYFVYRRRKDQEESFAQDEFIYEPEDNTFEPEEDITPEPIAKEESLEELIANDPVDDDVSDVSPLDRADIYIGFGQFDRAEAVLEKAVADEPENAAYRNKLIEVYEQQGKQDQAESQRSALAAIGAAAAVGIVAYAQTTSADTEEPVQSVDELDLNFEDEFDLSLNDLDLNSLDSKDQLESNETSEFDSLDLSGSFDEDLLAMDELAVGEASESLENITFDDKLILDEIEEEPLTTNFSDALFPTEDIKSTIDLDEDFDLELDANDLDLASLDDEISDLDKAEPLSLEPSLNDELDEALFESDLANLEAAFDSDELLKSLDESQPADNTGTLEDAIKQDAEALGFNEEDLANLESAFDTAELDLLANAEGDVSTASSDRSESEGSGAADELDELDLFESAEAGEFSFTAEDFSGSDDELDDELDFLANTDEAATKLDLARAYLDMGDAEGARDILDEVLSEGNDAQKAEANDLLKRLDA
ncbi:MAG: FimV/HubP family polar landmark protein [Cellvibrio sp.]